MAVPLQGAYGSLDGRSNGDVEASWLKTDKYNLQANKGTPTRAGMGLVAFLVVVALFGAATVTVKQVAHGIPGITPDSAAELDAYKINSLTQYNPHQPVDLKADYKTVALLTALKEVGNSDRFLFGHQNDNIVGQYFADRKGFKGNSDVKNATGSYPAMFGYDFTDILHKKIWGSKNFTVHVKYAYSQGGVITIDWLAYNPVTNGDYYNLSGSPCRDLLNESTDAHARWNGWLDEIADNIRLYVHTDGTLIPVIFRFLHETTGRWFWWGIGKNVDGDFTCTDSEYRGVWNYTHNYLHGHHDLHNILWTYAPAKASHRFSSGFVDRYPGNDKVDILGFDRYATGSYYEQSVLDDCRAVANFSIASNKVVAIAETGNTNGIQSLNNPHYYYRNFTKVVMEDKLCKHIAFSMAWENLRPDYYWVPLPEDKGTFEGFLELYQSNWSIFADDPQWNRLMQETGYFAV